MRERTEYPAGVPCWVDTAQPDPDAAAAFYGGLFGWEFEDRTPAGMPGRYLVGRLDGRDVAAVSSQVAGTAPAPAWSSYVAVDDADDAVARALAAGGSALMDPADVGEAGRVAVIADREGATLGLWQARGTIGAQAVNEPGTWSFSELNTRDPEGAAVFYEALFGWETVTVDIPQGVFSMFRMPGYGDHLEARDPGLRARQAADGAPEGFEDTVAWLLPLGQGLHPEGTPPHWSVTFATDDADAAAERAASLGGTVLAPPFDAPWVRMTVLRDPQGAVFTASRYTPPSA
jgi:predicted enzyme related to lactoylglutathione lyase